MYGVVLWSDQNKNRAVIWCEDHGDLAFYKGGEYDSHLNGWMDPGDLVRFDLKEENQLRLAKNLALVASDEYPTLARYLKEAGWVRDSTKAERAIPTPDKSAIRIIPFAPTTGGRIVAEDNKPQRKAL